MRLKAYGYRLTKDETELIRRMATHITQETIDVLDLMSYDLDIKPDDTIMAFGIRAKRACADKKCLALLEFPEPGRLDPVHGEKSEREAAYSRLVKFKEVLDSGDLNNLDRSRSSLIPKKSAIKLTEELLPDLTADKVRELERYQREQGKTSWDGVTKDGKTIHITVEPEENNADVNMTFVELFAVLGLMEAFRVKELEFVYKPSSTSRKSDPK